MISTSVQPLAYTQGTNGTASSGFVSSPQLSHSAIGSQVPAGPTRNVTGEVMPTSLSEAVTQLSFFEFLQRCNLLIAPPQPHQLPVPISPPDAAMQTTSRSAASQDVSTQMGARPASSFSLDAAVQTPLRCVLSHDTSTQNYRSLSSSLAVSSQTIAWTVKVRHQYNAVLIVPHRVKLLTLLRFAIPAIPALSETVTCTLRLHMSYCSHRRVSKSIRHLQVSCKHNTSNDPFSRCKSVQ